MIDGRAIVDPGARIAEGVAIGPYSVIGADVEIGPGTWIGPNVVINGPARIGRDNRIFQFSSLGEMPQDTKYGGEPTALEIGDRNTIREFCTFNRGTVQGGGTTRIGDDNWIMAYVHIAHDCQVGSHTIFANGASLAGHVTVADHVVLGGFTLVHQFCRLGAHAFTAYSTGLHKDVPPYVTVRGQPGRPHGINSEGLRRRGYSTASIEILRQAYKTLYRAGLRLEEAIGRLRSMAEDHPEVLPLVEFLETTTRSIAR
ncbi:MAG: acyl-[acyl-carrier-protein]--UDP-N-acetylglucosamine O-acyltransferase [Chromatiales bacterium 21-64-14]|nr:MAG: acyl-[acyl-carrier-protein]--UDP-N-acetylglucosamine O-acyltransferase [Chromatiales bacterium 21-64-14]HQU15132.1 acyl-ACP--UDP-N-acetylglucosamine O-acyltransferase [Gammaproteobacteria bacterium]